MPGPENEIEFSRLVDWIEGRLPEEEARAVEEQAADADGATLSDIAWLRKFFRAAQVSVLESAPREVRSTLIARFEAHAEGRKAPGLLQRITASLALDGGLGVPVGVRAGAAQDVRKQLIYSADTLDVALNFWPSDRGQVLDLEGQVFPRRETGLGFFGVQLLRGETEVATTATDDLGSFAFGSIPPGIYTAVLSTDQIEVSLARVELYP